MSKQPRRQPPRGRPSSHPAVVTTTIDNVDYDVNGGGGEGGGRNVANDCVDVARRSSSSSSGTAVVAPPPATKGEADAYHHHHHQHHHHHHHHHHHANAPGRDQNPAGRRAIASALRLYEDGDASSSLDAFEAVWGQQPRSATVDDDDDDDPRPTAEPLSRRHDRAVLRMLSSYTGGGSDAEGEGGECTRWEEVHSSILRVLEEGMGGGGMVDVGEGGSRTLLLNTLVGLYNVVLAKYSSCAYAAALDTILRAFSVALEELKRDDVAAIDRRGNDFRRRDVIARIAFLALDCHLALHGGDGRGMPSTIVGGGTSIDAEELLSWIEKGLSPPSSSSSSSSLSDPAGVGGTDEDGIFDATASSSHPKRHSSEHADELKFRLHLYRSRMLIVGATTADDAVGRTRAARKELKNAMDIYQNRLCIIVGDAGEEAEEGGVGRDQVRRFGGKNSRQQQLGGGKGGGGGKGKSPQDASETTSVASIAGGSLVTSTSDAFWNDGKGSSGGTATTCATFEGMPSKNATAPTTLHPQQLQPQSTKPIVSSAVTTAATKTKKGGTADLRKRHESVLYLKANLEYLRGNTSKSLKLCAEARSAGRRSLTVGRRDSLSAETPFDLDGGSRGDDASSNDAPDLICDDNIVVEAPSDPNGESQKSIDYGEALYNNNLALLHQTEGRFHLALRYYSHALYYIERAIGGGGEYASSRPPSCNFWSNGMARPDVTAEILNNESLCAYQAQEFLVAYTSMARCMRMSPSMFGMRARCWLRLAQSCIGMYARNQELSDTNEEAISHVDMIDSIELGSEKDLRNVSKNPLPRASRCLNRALRLSAGYLNADAEDPCADENFPSPREGSADVDMDCYEMALVSLAYVKLQQGDHASTQEITSIVFRLSSDKEAENSGMTQFSQTHIMAQVYYRDAMILGGS